MPLTNEDTQYIEDEIIRQMEQVVTEAYKTKIQKAAQRVLGVTFDHWGEISNVSQSFVARISSNKKVQAAKKQLYEKIAKQVAEKPLTAKQEQVLVKRVREKFMEQLEEKLLDELHDTFYNALKERLMDRLNEQIKRNPRIASLLVADELTKANSK